MVSMKDIANACNVSVATVSKALNDHRDIGEDTKERIRAMAKQMGYFPNSAAKALKTNRTYNIGVLFADEAQSGLTHDFFSYVLDSFKRTAEEHNYDLTFINCAKSRKTKLSYLEHARYRGFDGVVIACIDFNDPQVVELVNSNLPVVTIDHIFNNRIGIISDNVTGMKDLVTYIYQKGHRKIAYIHGEDSAVTQARLSSFYKTAKELGLQVPNSYIKEAAYRNTEKTAQKTFELLDLSDPPTCIIYPDDFASFGGINAVRERGLRVPEDIRLASFYGGPLLNNSLIPISTIHFEAVELGMVSCRVLIDLLDGVSVEQFTKLPFEVVLKESTQS